MTTTIWPEIRPELCDGCGKCLPACPSSALALARGKAVMAHPELCEYDGYCELACPAGAIAVPFAILFSDDRSDAGL